MKMAIIQLNSTNPQFSFLIKKNPETGLILRSIRKGIACGWYADASKYNIYFMDAANDISYKQNQDDHFEYLSVTRYNSPLFPLNAFNEFFSATLRAQSERDLTGYEHSIYINMIHMEKKRYIDFFAAHMKDCSFQINHVAYKSYSLTVSTRESLYYLLQVVRVICLFLAITGKEPIYITDHLLDKYVKSLQDIDAPFFIRSLFIRNFLNTREIFQQYKRRLETSSRYDIHFEYGGTAQQRRTYIENLLSFDKAIVDVGCGEGFYAIPFAAKTGANYYAIDVQEQVLRNVASKAKDRAINNLVLLHSVDHFVKEYNGERVDVIMTEVIEHMSEEDAVALIRQICHEVDFEVFIITTPNADFNPYYELAGYRHEDHKWEKGTAEFQTWMNDVVQGLGVQVEFVSIGDRVNHIHTTQGVILKKRGV